MIDVTLRPYDQDVFFGGGRGVEGGSCRYKNGQVPTLVVPEFLLKFILCSGIFAENGDHIGRQV